MPVAEPEPYVLIVLTVAEPGHRALSLPQRQFPRAPGAGLGSATAWRSCACRFRERTEVGRHLGERRVRRAVGPQDVGNGADTDREPDRSNYDAHRTGPAPWRRVGCLLRHQSGAYGWHSRPEDRWGPVRRRKWLARKALHVPGFAP